MNIKKLLATTLLFALAGVPALAQSSNNAGYDPRRPCRFYVVRKLPVPAHCLVELQGGWSTRPYIDGDFIFHDYDEYLRWRDRADYRHWKAGDYAYVEGSTPVAPPPPAPQMAPAAAPVTAPAGRALICPAELRVKLVPFDRARLAQTGWPAEDGEAVLRLDHSNPPHSSGAILTCYYGLGDQRGVYLINRPAGDSRCLPNAEGTGFSCTP